MGILVLIGDDLNWRWMAFMGRDNLIEIEQLRRLSITAPQDEYKSLILKWIDPFSILGRISLRL